MRRTEELKRRAHRFSPWVSPRPARCFIVPRLEELEVRLTPNITLTNAFLVDLHDHPLTPAKGEQIYVEADFTTEGLPSNASYRVSYTIDGVTLNTPFLNWGAGSSGTGNWAAVWGGWYAAPGTHNVTVTIDPTTYGTTSRSFSFTPVSAADLPREFVIPLGGTPFQTWGFANYVDVDPRSPTLADYTGGPYTYDGHTGHDMTLANFGSQDDGVPVYAAAAGTVVALHDGEYDRNTAASNLPGNYVDVDHGKGWHTIYYHFRTNTILVHVGDTVVAGQVLGLAGSSGSSTLGHLHFEVQHNGDVVEEEYDPNTFWVTPLPYQGTVRSILDSGVSSSGSTTLADISAEERPVAANIFSQASGQQISVWLNDYNAANDNLAFKAYKPDGTRYTPLDFSFTASQSRGGRWYYSKNLPANLDLGTWHIGIEINGTEMARDAFQVTAGGAGAARVTQGSTYVPNGRTTPIDFGTVSPGSSPPQRTFTVSNLGSATLTLSNLTLPSGFSLVGSFPSSIAIGASATFTLQMGTGSSGVNAGIVRFNSNDSNGPTYNFAVKGTVSGGNTGAIHGQVFRDLNGDAIENGTDAGLVGWTVSLINPANNSVLATTTTGYNGYYAFLNVTAGTYRVCQTPPAGWTQSTQNPADITVGTGDVLVSPFGVGIYLPTHFTISAPANATAGTAITFTVTAQDAFNNTAGGYSGTVTFTSSDSRATLPANSTLTNGAGTFSATLLTAGNKNITATDTATSSITGNAAVAVSAAAAERYSVSAPSSSTAGGAFSVTVTSLDAYGNIATGYTGTVHFDSGDGQAVLPSDYTFTSGDAGMHTFTNAITLKTAGSQSIIAADTVTSSVTGTSPAIVINPAAAIRLTVVATDSATAGTPFDLTVTALDPYGNIDINYQGTVQFTTSDLTGGQLPGSYAFTAGDNGAHTFAAATVLFTAGSQSITATDSGSGINGTGTVVVIAAPANHFGLAVMVRVTVGVPFDLTATALDAYGNTDTKYQGTVHFSTSDADPGVVLPDDYAFAPADLGVHTFSGGFTLVTVGLQTLTGMDTANMLTGSATVTVDPGGSAPLGGRADRHERPMFTMVIELPAPLSTIPNAPSDCWFALVDRLFASLNVEDSGVILSRIRHHAEGKMTFWTC
jgi:murein DD-endopeptidase MepM/ murein hydrolase activator NlpD